MISGIYDIHNKKGEKLLDALLAEAKSLFSLEDAQKKLGLPKNYVVKIISNLVKKKQVLRISQGLYAYFPPTEKKSGFNVSRIIGQIMEHRHTPYYVGLLSAADYYGAAHQKPQRLQIMIPQQISFAKAKELGISFHVQKHFPKTGLAQIKTPQGYLWYSSPELLALDLLNYEKASGGIDNVAIIIREIRPLLKNKSLRAMALDYPVRAVVQKLGYLLELFGAQDLLLQCLQRIIKKRGASVVGLSSTLPKKGSFNAKWSVLVNTTLEVSDDL